jgi:hypothetical protein
VDDTPRQKGHALDPNKEHTMNTKPTLKIELTDEQKMQVEQVTGKQIPAVKLSLEVLEERLTPIPGTDLN